MSKTQCCDEAVKCPDYKGEIVRVKKIVGQLEGVSSMMEEKKYCIDILQQLKAIRSAMHSLEANVLKAHLNTCVKSLLGESLESNRKIDELLTLFNKCDYGIDCICSCVDCECLKCNPEKGCCNK